MYEPRLALALVVTTGPAVVDANACLLRLNEELKMPDAGKSKSSKGSLVAFFGGCGGGRIACDECEFLTPAACALVEYLFARGAVGDSTGGVVMKLSSRGSLCSSPALKRGVNDSGSGESVL